MQLTRLALAFSLSSFFLFGAAKSSGPSLHDRIAQLIVVRGYGDYPSKDDPEYKRFEHWIRDDRVGGFIIAGRIRNGRVLAANPFELAAFVNHMQRLAHTPLLVASDFERGASMRVGETASFPYQMAFGAAQDLALTRRLGAETAREARAIGVNWVFAPDADVNNNPANPIINTRSFGEDPKLVAAHVGAFIEGAHSVPGSYVLVTAKHFPGHGDTSEDSHLQLPRVEAPLARLESLEWVPFRAAIAHGTDSIMTGHIALPAVDPTGTPSTLSKPVLTGILRNELRFKGLIVTDALEMAAVTASFPEGEAAVRAIEAGADVLLMPIDPDACIRAIEKAVASGRLTRRRIDESYARVQAAKQRAGLNATRFVSLDRISDVIDAPEARDLASQAAAEGLTLLRNSAGTVPLASDSGSCVVVLTEGQFSSHGETLLSALSRQAPQVRTFLANSRMPDEELNGISAAMKDCKRDYVAAFVTVAAQRGSVALEGGLNKFVSTLIGGPTPVTFIAFGNPYLLQQFPNVSAYLATFSTAESSESAVAAALLGRAPIRGKSPVSIPPLVKPGDGIDLPAAASK